MVIPTIPTISVLPGIALVIVVAVSDIAFIVVIYSHVPTAHTGQLARCFVSKYYLYLSCLHLLCLSYIHHVYNNYTVTIPMSMVVSSHRLIILSSPALPSGRRGGDNAWRQVATERRLLNRHIKKMMKINTMYCQLLIVTFTSLFSFFFHFLFSM